MKCKLYLGHCSGLFDCLKFIHLSQVTSFSRTRFHTRKLRMDCCGKLRERLVFSHFPHFEFLENLISLLLYANKAYKSNVGLVSLSCYIISKLKGNDAVCLIWRFKHYYLFVSSYCYCFVFT